jgi:hypothetical protein
MLLLLSQYTPCNISNTSNTSNTSSTLLQHFFNTSSTLPTLLQHFFNTSSTLLQHFFNTSSTLLQHFFNTSSTLLQHFFNTSSTYHTFQRAHQTFGRTLHHQTTKGSALQRPQDSVRLGHNGRRSWFAVHQTQFTKGTLPVVRHDLCFGSLRGGRDKDVELAC